MEKDNRISKEFILDVFYDIDNPKIEEPLVKKIETSENITKQISEKNSTNNVTKHKNSKNDFSSHKSNDTTKHLNSENDSSKNNKVQKISENDSSSDESNEEYHSCDEDLSDIPNISSDDSKKKKKKKNSEISSIYKENQNYIRKRKPLNLTISDVEAGSDDEEGGNDVKFDLRKSLAAKDFPKRKSAKLINYKADEDENLSESD